MRLLILYLATLGLISCSGEEGGKMDKTISQENGIAIGGFDPVAYFVKDEATRGKTEISLEWQGARWLFANEQNKSLFEASPQQYAPQFGGHCAFATSLGKSEKGNPEHWIITDGKLYLNSNSVAHLLWKIIPGRLKASHRNYDR